ncbi:two-component system OmpR family response regulator [Litoreibacter meonggei]|uniref:Two-component system OmpR family response regulator n=1 Tax=Litoreibacter meonggei TaxID=1049199 RepID=A0A497WYV4_9RHOB|nr:response regulator transcription factor [Litoreibacter meonggei]RLJ59548.1 two-component system OmpR family response regulator [Litoreibacter meonggei]
MKADILVVDDDASIRSVISMALEDAEMQVSEATNGAAALIAQRRNPADLIVLDIGMPELDGFETCQALRKFSKVPVLFLTARDDEIDRVLGFQLGGDDYVTKPFSPRELVLRIKAILSRVRADDELSQSKHGDLVLKHNAHEAILGSQELELTSIEFSVLTALVSRPDQVFTRDQLITAVYGHNVTLSDRTVDSHVRNLRQKARKVGYVDIIRTIHGVGLRLGTCTQ